MTSYMIWDDNNTMQKSQKNERRSKIQNLEKNEQRSFLNAVQKLKKK